MFLFSLRKLLNKLKDLSIEFQKINITVLIIEYIKTQINFLIQVVKNEN